MENKRRRTPTRGQYKGLRGWKELSEEDFEIKYQEVVLGGRKDDAIQARIGKMYAEFESEYNLEELMPNDRAILRSLIQSIILLDLYQNQMFALAKDSKPNEDVTYKVDKLGKICNQLTNDISRMQDDLKITRRARKTEKEQSVIAFLDDLKQKAKKFYEQKMVYIICPKCKTILATVWVLYPEYKTMFVTECHRVVDDQVCGTKVSVNIKDLIGEGSNLPEVLPESVR